MNPDTCLCFFASDLHGVVGRYEALFQRIREFHPAGVFLGGDLLSRTAQEDFLQSYLVPQFSSLQAEMGAAYPQVLAILGNDDPRCFEPMMLGAAEKGLWTYAHCRKTAFYSASVYGYSCVPPTPFRLKDWERYDVSRYCDPGCVSPEEGMRTVEATESEVKWSTIGGELEALAGAEPLDRAVFLFHSPPYDTCLDRAALDGVQVDHAPLDVHVGSIAIRRFIESRQPSLTLHGHVHESAILTGEWKTKIGKTICMSAAHSGPELALVSFDLGALASATRELL